MANIINVSVGGSVTRVKTVDAQNVGVSPGSVAVIGKSPYINEETGTWMVYSDKERRYIDSGVAAGSEEIQDTNTTYQIVQDQSDGRILRVQHKNIGDEFWTDDSTITIPDDDTVMTNAEIKSIFDNVFKEG